MSEKYNIPEENPQGPIEKTIHCDKDINGATLREIKEVYSAAKRKVGSELIPFNERMEITRKAMKLREMIPKIDQEEYFEGLGIIDEKILEIEQKMGMLIDFFDPESLKLFLDFYEKMRNDNTEKFLKEIGALPSINSSGFLWSVELFKRGGALADNYPSRIVDDFTFSSRLIARICLNQIKHKGLHSPELENIILRAIPPYREGNAIGDIDSEYLTEGGTTLEEIVKESEEARIEFSNLPNSEEVSEIVTDTLEKLQIVDSFRDNNTSIEEGIETIVSDEIRQIIQEKQEQKPFATFFGHKFSYAHENLSALTRKWKD